MKYSTLIVLFVIVSFHSSLSRAAYVVEGISDISGKNHTTASAATLKDSPSTPPQVIKAKPVLMEETVEDTSTSRESVPVISSEDEIEKPKETPPLEQTKQIESEIVRKEKQAVEKAPEPQRRETYEPTELAAKKTRAGEIMAFPALAGALSQQDDQDPDDAKMQYDFDLEFPMDNNNSLRYYNTHAEGRSLRSGVEWKHERYNGKFRKWEVTNFQRTPQMDDSLGLKFSYGSDFRETAFAVVFLPEYDTLSSPMGSWAGNSDRVVFIGSLRKKTNPKFLLKRGRLNSYYSIDKTYQAAFIGVTPLGYSLSKADVKPRLALEWAPVRGSSLEVAYENNIRLGELGYNLLAVRSGRNGADWVRILTHNGTGEIGYSQEFRNANIYYRLNTTTEFSKERELVGVTFSKRGYALNAQYTRNFGYNDFYEVPDKEVTRISLTKKIRKNYEAGALFESRRDGHFVGFQLFTEGAGGNHMPDTIYREMNIPKILGDNEWEYNKAACKNIKNLDDAVGTLKKDISVAAYTSCLNTIKSSQNYIKVAPPKDVLQGAKMNCISSAWFQSFVLSNNGYIAYPVGLQASTLFLGEVQSDEIDQMHAIVAYKRPKWKYWRLMDYDEIITTTGETIEEALRAYDPNYTGFSVFDPNHLTMLGMYNNATLEEIDTWMEDKD